MFHLNFRHIYQELVKGVYSIGFLRYNPAIEPNRFDFTDVCWIKMNGYKHGWFADPFILEVNDTEIILLVEELEYHNKKGRLCKIRVSADDYRLLEVIPILSLDTHLSYPSIYRHNGNIYVCPENGEGGSVKVYELKNDKLVNPKAIIQAPLVDTQILQYKNKYYAFGVTYDLSSQDETKKLHVYESDDFLGTYRFVHSIVNSQCLERGAGNIIYDDSRIIRPVQICEDGYGRGIVLYELECRDNRFVEHEIGRIVGSFWSKWGVGIHQIHTYGGVTVIDGRDFNNRLVGCLKRLRNRWSKVAI